MTRACIILCIFLLHIFPGIQTRAQEIQDDSARTTTPADTSKPRHDSTIAYYFNNNFDLYGRLNIKTVDTSILNSHKYDPADRSYNLRATLGNIGSASRSVIPYPFHSTPGFDYGIHALDPWLFQNDSVKYYKVQKTYTDIKYVQGAKKEIFFKAAFSRNLYKSLNIGFDFRVLSSTGFYQRQLNNTVNFVLTAQYFTPDRRYAVIANMILNRVKNQENGGLEYDSLFTQDLEENRFNIPVNLQSAQNRVRETGVYVKNYFTLTFRGKTGDTTRPPRKELNLGRLVYSFQYNRQIHHFQDTDPVGDFYPTYYYDSTLTNDSLQAKRFINEIGWTNPAKKAGKEFKTLLIDLRLRHQYIELYDIEGINYLVQWTPLAGLAFQPYYGLRLEAAAAYVMGDYNDGDVGIRADMGVKTGNRQSKSGTLHILGVYALQEPSWFMHRYYGNHFRWDTAFDKQGIITWGGYYDWRFLNAGATISRINHYAYLGTSATPEQLTDEIGYFMAWLRFNIPVWRFNFEGRFAYQDVSGTEALQVPAFTGNLTASFVQPLFKGAATIEPGVNLYYNTAYYANQYMPDIRSFYLQFDQKIGNYLYMDVFLNVKIQRARIFLMYSHFNAGWMGNDYFTTPTYPMPDAAFRFGVTWRFHD